MAASVEYVLSQLLRWTSSHTEELPDAVLLQRFVQRRDEAAFAALVARHGAMVLRSCRRVLGDVHDAEDAFQATFLILARKAHTLRNPATLPGFLYRIAHRVALKSRSKVARSAQTPLPETLSDPSTDPLTQLTARELLTVLDEEVQHLPAAQRSAVLLCCVEGHTQEEVARQLGWTPGSLKGHLERGRKRLQTRLKRRGIGLSAALALMAVSRGEAASALLLRSTVAAAIQGTLSGQAAALAGSVLKGMFLGKLAATMALVLTITLAASATVAWVYRGSTAETPEEKPPAAVAAKPSDDKKPQTRTDALGDPLPEGAIARLGTLRLRNSRGPVVFSPDGKYIVAARGDNNKEAVFWDRGTGRRVKAMTVKESIFRLAFSPDGKKLAAVGNDGRFNPVWDVASGKELYTFKGNQVAFVGEGKELISTNPEGERSTVRTFDAATGRRLTKWTL